MGKKIRMDRRIFLKRTAAGAIGAGISGAAAWPFSQESEPIRPAVKIKEFRTLGRTGFRVSDLAAGSISDDGLLRFALDAGVNYIDSAEQYPGHHRLVGKVLKGRDRSQIFVASKIEVEEDKSKEGFLKRAYKCLEELETDYLDCLMMHMPEKVETLKTEGFHQAMAVLKAEKRVHFVGVSNHGSFWFRDPAESMERVLQAAAEDGRFDVFLMAYNFLNLDQSGNVLRLARQKNIGTVLMKTTPIGIYYSLKARIEQLQKEGKEVDPLYSEGLKRYQEKLDRAQEFIKRYNLQKPEEIRDAAIRFCLGNPDVGTVCVLAKTYGELEEHLRLSGTRLSQTEMTKLKAYQEGCGELYCRHACGRCEPSCPKGVPVNTILRYHHYFAAQGREREAMELYARIPGSRADACRDCTGYCEKACPHGVPAQGMLLLADSRLALP